MSKCLFAAMAGFVLSAATASATTLDFEGLPPNALEDGYGGLNWSNFAAMAISDPADPGVQIHGVTSGLGFASNLDMAPASFSSATAFTLNGLFLTDPWGDGFSVLIEAFLGDNLTHTLLLSDFPNTPVAVNLDWTNIDEARFNAFLPGPNPGQVFGRTFVMDDLRINNPIAPVPLAASLPMMALALGALGLVARRQSRRDT